MSRSLENPIITCALTGSIHTPSMSEYLPVTPEEIIEEGVEAAQAGASIVHIHVRDPTTGEPVSDLDLFREVAAGIKAETDVIVQPTTGGGTNQTVDERFAVIPELEPEMASFNMGSMTFGLHELTNLVDEFEYDWEKEYLEAAGDHVVPNTFANLEYASELFADHGTKPELECYDVGHVYNAKHLYDKGILEPPLHIQFVMGVLGGIGTHHSDLDHLVQTTERLFGDDASWSVIGAGRREFPLGIHALSRGGNTRVGLEDNLYSGRGTLAKSNAELVDKITDVMETVTGRQPAQPDEVREFLDLKGKQEVAF